MDPVDICAILGKALNNAIKSVQGLSDPERRMIDVLICREKIFTVFQAVNPMEGTLNFWGGLPLSTGPGTAATVLA